MEERGAEASGGRPEAGGGTEQWGRPKISDQGGAQAAYKSTGRQKAGEAAFEVQVPEPQHGQTFTGGASFLSFLSFISFLSNLSF